ncbi:hypothetical protein AQUCO_00201024v1 [Aquilegia coerulea]|uniref:Insecticidal crystal toxin domain-containing protein n=1 Tax=Aquilegia coerulea TaxID=218851 RepID=A0A2G5F5U3_AQUCA|nr:hypothetical protein AQUCO_00201024v1 [Aquilegia coerulea]
MYATRRLSMYRKDPDLLSESPVGTQHSGFLVITDEETEAEDIRWWGGKDTRVRKLPFPQNKLVNVLYRTSNGNDSHVDRDKVWFIPVLDQPLSSNRYYVVKAKGKYKGQVCTCSEEEDMAPCCFYNIVIDVKPRDLDYRDIYQQVQIFKRSQGYNAKSIAPDGFPPSFLRRKGWTVETSSSFQCQLSEAHGLNFALREELPELTFPISSKRSTALVVGKWYCPFVFVKESQQRLNDQMEKSLLYEMTLEHWWEEIYTCNNDFSGNKVVSFSVNVQKEVNSLSGVEAVRDHTIGVAETIWYKSADSERGVLSLGLSKAIVDKMTWVQEIGGWVGGNDKDVEVKRTEEFKEGKEWQRFGCFVLVERFGLRRMDGKLLLTCDFRHTHQIQCKWE